MRLASASHTLAVAEGIETALAVMKATGMPTWAALSTVGLQTLVLPPAPLASGVFICADNDAPGLAAAFAAAARWSTEGRRVHIARPMTPDTDFNDLLLCGAKA